MCSGVFNIKIAVLALVLVDVGLERTGIRCEIIERVKPSFCPFYHSPVTRKCSLIHIVHYLHRLSAMVSLHVVAYNPALANSGSALMST